MNVSDFSARSSGALNQPLRRSTDLPVRYDQEGRKMAHTSFRQQSFKDAFWDVVKTLPRDQQVSLAANALASQLQQTGDSLENREFIRSFATRFSDAEKTSLKQSLETHPMLNKATARQRGEYLFLLDRLWGEAGFQDALKKHPQDFQNPTVRPEDLFFKTSQKGDWRRNRVMAAMM